MAIKFCIQYLLTLFLLITCSSKDKIDTDIIKRRTLSVREANDTYFIKLDNSNIIQLVSDKSKTTQLVVEDEKRIKLDFYIIPPYLTGAYMLYIKGFGKILALESYSVGASGLSANVINVSLIILEKPYFYNVVSYNSFYAGIDLLKYCNNNIVLNVYDFCGFDISDNVIYCENTFVFTGKDFISEDTLTNCVIFGNNEQVNNNKCNCSPLKNPFVNRQ